MQGQIVVIARGPVSFCGQVIAFQGNVVCLRLAQDKAVMIQIAGRNRVVRGQWLCGTGTAFWAGGDLLGIVARSVVPVVEPLKQPMTTLVA